MHPSSSRLSCTHICPGDLNSCRSAGSYVPESVRASRWSVAAALPATSATSTVVAVPPLHMSVQDDAVMGVRGALVRAEVFSFGGTCASASTPAAGSLPRLKGDVSNETDVVGVAHLWPVSYTHLTLPTTPYV